MKPDVQIIESLVTGVVWVVGLVIAGRLGMFIAVKHFSHLAA